MTKWTKGPWTYQLSEGWGFCVRANGKYVAWRLRSAEDAHLMAAAPDLYEALTGILAITDRNHDAWEMAHKAMAKARGESND